MFYVKAPLLNKKKSNIAVWFSFQDVTSTKSERRCFIYVTDVNDNAPDFDFALSSDNYIELQMNEGDYSNYSGNGFLINQIQANDNDGTSPNNKVGIRNTSSKLS